MDRLREIIEHKREEILPLIPLTEKLAAAALEREDFRSLEFALTDDNEHLSLIAEVKKASPSAGTIRSDVNPVTQALAYEEAGANAISVLTDEKFFSGKLDYLTKIRNAVSIPVLRKDFIIHECQIYEAVVAGADAILLIVAALGQKDLERLFDIAQSVQLEVLMEVHDLAELDRALDTDARIIGVNNRNLKTFKVDLETTEQLADEVPPDLILVSESGIKTPRHAAQIASWRADAILVGESLMRADDIPSLVADLKAKRAPAPSGDEA